MGSPAVTVSAARPAASPSAAPSTTTTFSAPNCSANSFTLLWFSRSMAPAAVHTKHSVEENTTSPPAVFTHSSIAGPGIPSLSPMMMTFFSFKMLMISTSFLLQYYVQTGRQPPFKRRLLPKKLTVVPTWVSVSCTCLTIAHRPVQSSRLPKSRRYMYFLIIASMLSTVASSFTHSSIFSPPL